MKLQEGVPSQFYIGDGYFDDYGDNRKSDPDISSSVVRGIKYDND